MMSAKNIICPVCGASCDDIAVELSGDSITVKNACKMEMPSFRRSSAATG